MDVIEPGFYVCTTCGRINKEEEYFEMSEASPFKKVCPECKKLERIAKGMSSIYPTYTMNIKNCSACGKDHDNFEVTKDTLSDYYHCPLTGKRVFIANKYLKEESQPDLRPTLPKKVAKSLDEVKNAVTKYRLLVAIYNPEGFIFNDKEQRAINTLHSWVVEKMGLKTPRMNKIFDALAYGYKIELTLEEKVQEEYDKGIAYWKAYAEDAIKGAGAHSYLNGIEKVCEIMSIPLRKKEEE